MITLFTESNFIFVLAHAFVTCIIAGVFQMSKITEKMGDDKK